MRAFKVAGIPKHARLSDSGLSLKRPLCPLFNSPTPELCHSSSTESAATALAETFWRCRLLRTYSHGPFVSGRNLGFSSTGCFWKEQLSGFFCSHLSQPARVQQQAWRQPACSNRRGVKLDASTSPMACKFEEIAAGNIERILIIYAMQAEASPLVDALKLKETNECVFPKGVPWVRYNGAYERLIVDIVVPGKDPVSGVDNVGTVSIALVTYAAVYALKPDLIINAGTAGGFKTRGACVGDVFVVEEVANHDRRIPLPFFEEYGIGATKLVAVTNLVKTIGLKVGKLSTGNSLDMSPHDEQLIKANDAALKDMEGAAVAYVAKPLFCASDIN